MLCLKSLFFAIVLSTSTQAVPVANTTAVSDTSTLSYDCSTYISTDITLDSLSTATFKSTNSSENWNVYSRHTYYSSSLVSTATQNSYAPVQDATVSKSTATTSQIEGLIHDTTQVHNGVATYYSVSNDNCGTSSTDSDFVCAISQQLYNTVANSDSISEYCGHMINITYNGKTIQVKVVDSCESCDSEQLDLSPSAFQSLADLSVGVIDIQWEWA